VDENKCTRNIGKKDWTRKDEKNFVPSSGEGGADVTERIRVPIGLTRGKSYEVATASGFGYQ